MNETIVIGEIEKLKIIFSENIIQFENSSDDNKNGEYPYSEIKDVKLNKEKTLWLVSIITWVVDIITDIHIGSKYRQKKKYRNINRK